MKTVTIDPSIAAIVNIDNIGKTEVVPVYFTAEANWIGTYEFKLWNSDKKNTDITRTANPLVVNGVLMTLTIDASAWNVVADEYYYEITKTEDKRIVFKGNLNIIK